jgi:ABC-2 type transport system permease protein
LTSAVEVVSAGLDALEVRRSPTLADAFLWEVTKLASLMRTRVTLLLCLLAPIAIVFILKGQQPPPKDTLYGRYIHESGYAVALLMLGFATQWLLPLLTAIVAGDIFASENSYGTWKTVLTRSVSRKQVFWGKTLAACAFALTALTVLAASTLLTSVAAVGAQPVDGLSGQLIPSGTAFALVAGSWASTLIPVLGFTCLAILLSARTGNAALAIAGTVVIGQALQLIGGIGAAAALRPLLLTTPFAAWHGLLAQYRFYSLLGWGAVSVLVWSAVCLTWAFLYLRKRDITEG